MPPVTGGPNLTGGGLFGSPMPTPKAPKLPRGLVAAPRTPSPGGLSPALVRMRQEGGFVKASRIDMARAATRAIANSPDHVLALVRSGTLGVGPARSLLTRTLSAQERAARIEQLQAAPGGPIGHAPEIRALGAGPLIADQDKVGYAQGRRPGTHERAGAGGNAILSGILGIGHVLSAPTLATGDLIRGKPGQAGLEAANAAPWLVGPEAGLAARAIAYSAPFLAQGGMDVGHDVGRAARGDYSFSHTRGYGRALGSSVAKTVTDPGANPFLTAITAYAALSGGAGLLGRVGAAGGALRAGEGLGTAFTRPGSEGGSLLHAPGPIARPLTYQGATVFDRDYSRNALARILERGRDAAQHRYPNLGIRVPLGGGRALTLAKTLPERLGHATAENVRYGSQIDRAAAQSLARQAHSRNIIGLPNYDTAQQAAVHMHLEDTPPETTIPALQKWAADEQQNADRAPALRAQIEQLQAHVKATGEGAVQLRRAQNELGASLRSALAVRRLNNQIGLHNEARKFLQAVPRDDGSLGVTIRPEYPKLLKLAQLAETVSNETSPVAAALGRFKAGTAEARQARPALEYEAAARGEETPLQQRTSLRGAQAELERLRGSSLGRRVSSLQTILARVEKTVGARGTAEHGPELDALRAAFAEHINHYGHLQDVLGTKEAQAAADAGIGVGPTGALKRGASADIPTGLPVDVQRELFGGRTFEVAPGKTTPAVPLGESEARARVASSNADYNKLIAKIEAEVGHPYLHPSEYRKAQLERNKINGQIAKSEQATREGKTYRKQGASKSLRAGLQPSVKDEIRAHAEAHLDKTLSTRLDDPGVQEWAKRLAETARLERGLHHLDEIRNVGGVGGADEFGGVFSPSGLGREPTQEDLLHHLGPKTPEKTTPAVATERTTTPKIAVTLSGARAELARLEAESRGNIGLNAQVSLLRTELDRAFTTKRGARLRSLLASEETRMGRLQQIEDEAATSGRGRAFVEHAQGAPKKLAGAFRVGTGKGENIGIAQPPRTLRGENEGVLQRTGALDMNGPKSVAAHALDISRYQGRVGLHDFLTATNEEGRYLHLRDTPEQVKAEGGRPVRIRTSVTRTQTPEMRDLLARLDAGEKLGPSELATVARDEHAFVKHVFPTEEEIAHEGDRSGVKFIDERLLGRMNVRTPPNELVKLLGGYNRAQRFALLHANPGYYSTIGLSNYLMDLQHQGIKMPLNALQALRARSGRLLKPANEARMRGAMGGGYAAGAGVTESPTVGGMLQRGLTGVENMGRRLADTTIEGPPREMAFLHEARRAGYKTTSQLDDLLENPAKRADLIRTARRASESTIDFGRLGPHEQSLIRQLWFFYPWAKGATLYTGWLAREHPALAAALAHGGNVSYQHAIKTLGPLPSSAFGAYPTGGHEKIGGVSYPKVLKLGAINVPNTVLDNIRALTGQGGDSLGSIATPGIQALAAGLFHYNLGRGQQYQPTGPGAANYLLGSLKDLYHSQADALPPMLLRKRLAEAGNDRSQANKVLPLSSHDAWTQFLIRGPAARPYNPVAGQAQIARDELANAAPGKQKIDVEMSQLEQRFEKVVPELAHNKGFLTDIRRFTTYREAIASAPKIGGKLQPQDELKTTLNYLADEGAVPKATAAAIIAAMGKQTDLPKQTEQAKAALKQVRSAFNEYLFPPGLKQLASAVKVKLPSK